MLIMSANIKDVAKEAGVSTATVSYVLNNKLNEKISKETIDKVNAAVKKLNYVPNLSARSLISKKSNRIGLVFIQMEHNKRIMFSNPYYGEFLSSVEYAARKLGYRVLLTGTDSDQSYIDVAKNHSLDGIIIVGMYPDKFYDELKQIQIPIVLVDSYSNDHYFHSIGINDRYGGYLATNYLIKKGHKKIAFVSGGIWDYGVDSNRFLGYKDSLEECGLVYNERYVYTGSVDYNYGMRAAEDIINGKNGETAIFASADILATGLLKGFKNKGFNVPEDFSVIGFDDLFIATICEPSLTTVRQNITEKAEIAAKLIIDASNQKLTGKRDMFIPIEIVERCSVKSIK